MPDPTPTALSRLTRGGPRRPIEVPLVDHEHPDVSGGWLRPAVFGAMDGLVSNAALIAGVAGGTQEVGDNKAVVLAGLAGLAAGAFSMAAGEYASVASQSEAAEREIAIERAAIIAHPEAEREELVGMLMERGIERELADEVATQVHRDLDAAVAIHALEEFGVDPDELASPTVAAVSSFVSFSLGALVPVAPFLVGGNDLLWWSMGITLLALFLCGAVVTRLTNRPWWFGGLRQVLLGSAAFAVTYWIGTLVGAGLG